MNELAAPQATEAPAQRSWAEISATALEKAPIDPAQPAAAPPGAAPAPAPALKEWEPPPPPRPRNMHERLLLKSQREQSQATQQPLEARLQETTAKLAELTSAQANAQAEFKRLVDVGDVDGALKVIGVPASMKDINTAYIRGKKLLPPSDPRYEELSKQNQALQARIEAREKAEAEAREQAEAEAQHAEWIDQTKAELAALPYKGAEQLAGAPGFAQACLDLMSQHPGLTSEQAAANVRPNYQALYESLRPAFEAQPASKAVRPPALASASQVSSPRVAGVAPLTTLPPAGSAPSAPPLNETPDERWKRISAEALALQG